jgi:diguanylate cyclase (GGDEF)-like protein
MRILLAEDNATFRQMLQDALARWGYEVTVAADGLAAWQALQGPDAPRLAVLDWVMPGLDGLQLCRLLRQQPATPYTYLLLLTARADREDIVGGLEAGADDYLVKPIDVQELRARLRTGRRILDLQQRLLEAHEGLRHQATHDPLTGVWNRAAVLDSLDRELARGRREGRPVGLVLADVDHFKRVNDSYGHPAGDAVLREVARRLGHALRPYDTLGRYGGEEFLVVLPDCDAAGTLHLAERLRQVVRESAVDVPDGMIPVTVSLGAASSSPGGPADAPALIWAADRALYRAKGLGRDRAEGAANPGPAAASTA